MEPKSTSARSTPSFKEFTDFIRTCTGISMRKQIVPETLFERDLGVTGDDGCELLEAIEDHYGVCLLSRDDGYRSTFGLAPHEFLFHSEGLGGLLDIFSRSSVRAFTVGDLFEAVRHAPLKAVKHQIVPGVED
jgi:hypothetical protein